MALQLTPSLTLPLAGGGDAVAAVVREFLTTDVVCPGQTACAFPLPGGGRVREGGVTTEGVMSGFRSARQKKNAKALRSNMTEVEKILWYHLRAHRFMGLSVRRQAPVGPYIVDFLIPSRRLILEADGAHHDRDRDAARNAYLSALGYRILRLSNHDIRTNLSGVLSRIAEEATR